MMRLNHKCLGICTVGIMICLILIFHDTTRDTIWQPKWEQYREQHSSLDFRGAKIYDSNIAKTSTDLYPQLTDTQSMDVLITKTTTDLHPELTITQSMDVSMPDGYRMHLACAASVNINLTDKVVMTWSGMGLQQSLWVSRSHVTKQEGYIERKLFFKPWLDMHAGEYTCSLNVKGSSSKFTVKKAIMVTGKYHGLVNSRNTSQKFDSSTGKPSKWFPNAKLCAQDDIWQNYADFHAAVLSGKQKGKYLIYHCSERVCGGYGNRLHGITVLLIYAMLSKRVFLLRMTRPVDINAYLLSNAIQWNHNVPKGLKSIAINLHGQTNLDSKYEEFEAALLHNDNYDVIRVETSFGLFYYLLTMSDLMIGNLISTFNLKTQYDVVLLYGCAFNYLFKYQPRVIQAIQSLQAELGLETGRFVSLHVRSYITEGYVFNPLHLKFPYKLMFDCAVMAAKSLSHKLNVSKVPIFLATDHPSVIAYAKENYNDMIVLSRSPSFHVDRTRYSGSTAKSNYDSGMIGVLSDVEICSRGGILVRSAWSTLSEVMGAIHFLRPQHNLHPFYFYDNLSVCH